MRDDILVEVVAEAVAAVHGALAGLDDWGLAGTRDGQYRSDLVADRAAVAVLDGAGLGVLSEESGLHHGERALVAVLDPVDGSTNASRGLPWWATSICVVDGDGPLVATVVNQATGTRWEAVRGGGARRDGQTARPSDCTALGDALLGVSGWPEHRYGWRQFRALGASALDLCSVGSGSLDGFVDCSTDAHGPWDYMGALLVCTEAGAPMQDAFGRDLVVLGHQDRRTPVAAATRELLAEVLSARLGEGSPKTS